MITSVPCVPRSWLQELPGLLAEHDIDAGRAAISGHSMGGHGALIMGLRNPVRVCTCESNIGAA